MDATPDKKIRAAFIGCGNVATSYARHCENYPHIELAGFYDLMPERAKAMAEAHGGKAYSSLDELLADQEIDLAVNLTIHTVHAEVTAKCLNAGKDVLSEKPFAMTLDDSRMLIELAEKTGRRLSSAPITYLGEAQQTAYKLIRENKLGTPRLIYAEVNQGRIETWHPNPEPFYNVGIMWDVGVYPVTLSTAFFGPITRVQSIGKLLYPNRVTQEGRPFTITRPDCVFNIIEFANGITMRLTGNFYAPVSRQKHNVEFHGDDGMVFLGSFQDMSSEVGYAPFGGDYEDVPLLKPALGGLEVGKGIEEMGLAMLENRPCRANPRHAAHVIAVLCAVEESLKLGKPVDVSQEFVFDSPEPMPWAL